MSHTTTDMPLSKIPTSSPTEPENHLDSMPIEAHTAAGPTLLADAESPGRVEQKSLYVFRRLREERTLPGPVLLGLMLYVASYGCDV
jgi:hypothetical protein